MKFHPLLVLGSIPKDFITDCCSGVPPWVMSLLARDLKPYCRAHDAAYCTRLFPAGWLDQEWRRGADYHLGVEVRSEYPPVLDWIGWLFFSLVHRFGGDQAYDSCGIEAGIRCRHGQLPPDWMHGSKTKDG